MSCKRHGGDYLGRRIHSGGEDFYLDDDDNDEYLFSDDEVYLSDGYPNDMGGRDGGCHTFRDVTQEARQCSRRELRSPEEMMRCYLSWGHGPPPRDAFDRALRQYSYDRERDYGAASHGGRHGIDSLNDCSREGFSSEDEGARRREHGAGGRDGHHRRDTVRGVRGGGRRGHTHHGDPHVVHAGRRPGGDRDMGDFGDLPYEDDLGLSDEGMVGPSRRHGGGIGGRDHGVGGRRHRRHGGGREGGRGAPRLGGGHGAPGHGGRRGMSLADFSDGHESDY